MVVYVGFDPREAAEFAVCVHSITRHITQPLPIRGLVLRSLQEEALYVRPHTMKPAMMEKPIMWDVISDAPMSTEHANARFLIPTIETSGWHLFMDGDMLVRGNVARVFDKLDNAKAIYCVKHDHQANNSVKMDGQYQTNYARKNWSSFMLVNCSHKKNRSFANDDLANTLPGRDLHRFCWLEDEDIGELPLTWNWLVGSSPPLDNPNVVHYTNGTPRMAGYEKTPFADEWREELSSWARLQAL